MESETSTNFDFGANLLSLREKKLLSQDELGAKIGATGSAIGQYERNEITPRKAKLLKLAAALDTTEAVLLGFKQETNHTSVPKPEVKELPNPVEVTKSYAPDLIEVLKEQVKVLKRENKKLRREIAEFSAKVKA